MTAGQKSHIRGIVKEFAELAIPKYAKGTEEHKDDGHGGNLWENSASELVSHATEELLDGFIYIRTLKAKVEELEARNTSLLAEIEWLDKRYNNLRDNITKSDSGYEMTMDYLKDSADRIERIEEELENNLWQAGDLH